MSLASQSLLSTASTDHPATANGIELAQEVLANFGWLRLGVTGGSMLPAVMPGDVLSFERRSLSSLKPGQVILTRFDDRLVAHRLLACNADGLLTQGDSLPHPDAQVTPADVLGVMVRHERGQRELTHAHGQQRLSLHARMTRWLIRRSSMARRACLHWQRLAGPIT